MPAVAARRRRRPLPRPPLRTRRRPPATGTGTAHHRGLRPAPDAVVAAGPRVRRTHQCGTVGVRDGQECDAVVEQRRGGDNGSEPARLPRCTARRTRTRSTHPPHPARTASAARIRCSRCAPTLANTPPFSAITFPSTVDKRVRVSASAICRKRRRGTCSTWRRRGAPSGRRSRRRWRRGEERDGAGVGGRADVAGGARDRGQGAAGRRWSRIRREPSSCRSK